VPRGKRCCVAVVPIREIPEMEVSIFSRTFRSIRKNASVRIADNFWKFKLEIFEEMVEF